MKRSSSKFISLLFPAGLIIYLSSCAPAYVPNKLNTPLHNNKGEFQASANFGFSGFDPQVAYAITDHIGIMVNGSFRNSTSDSSDSYHKHNFIEGGGGYYTKFEEIGRFEVYAGYGFGKLQAYYESSLWDDYADANCNRVFIQPALGISTQIFEGSIAPRFVFVDIRQNDLHETGYFFEPALTLKLGYKYVKVTGQFGLSYPMNGELYNFDYNPFIFSLGLQMTLGRKYE